MPSGKYKMGTISRKTGFSPMLLRAWERRHSLLEPERGSGGHRLYTEDDLQVLYQVKEHLDLGRSIGEVAVMGRETLLAERSDRPAGMQATPPAAASGNGESTLDREFDGYCQSIVDSAARLDHGGIDRALDEALARFAPDAVVHNVITPSAREIGRRWMSGELSVAGEHMASDIFVHRIGKLLEAAGMGRQRTPRALCGCFPDENHRLGLLILAYELTRRGVRVDFLGAALPFEDLEFALDTLRPRGVLLSVTRTALFLTHRPRLIEIVRRRKDETKFILGGQGTPEDDHELVELGVELWDARLQIDKLMSRLRL